MWICKKDEHFSEDCLMKLGLPGVKNPSCVSDALKSHMGNMCPLRIVAVAVAQLGYFGYITWIS